MTQVDANHPILHGRKVSEVFVEFAQPYLLFAQKCGKLDDLEANKIITQIVPLVWNVVLIGDDYGDQTFQKMYNDLRPKLPPVLIPIMNELFALKRGPFKKYKYMLTEVTAYRGEAGEIRFRVATGIPKNSTTH